MCSQKSSFLTWKALPRSIEVEKRALRSPYAVRKNGNAAATIKNVETNARRFTFRGKCVIFTSVVGMPAVAVPEYQECC